MHAKTIVALLVATVLVGSAAATDGPRVRVWDEQQVPATLGASIFVTIDGGGSVLLDSRSCPAPVSFRDTGLARFGDDVPGVGPLYLIAPGGTANFNSAGQAAFFSNVDGADRSHGLFVVDPNGIRPIVMGCGGGGGSGQPGNGCGDPSPIGGTFSGVFGFTPAFNDAGDVVFLADVDGGSAPRGLFLYRAATQQFVKIAAIGDNSPAGGPITSLGLASMNNNADVLFLAERNAVNGPVDILKWSNGTVTTFVKVGDAAPGGGTFSLIGREYFGFQDGTRVYSGNVPGINNAGQAAFFSLVAGGQAERGIFLRAGGTTSWYLRAGDPTPAGGTYLDFWQPLLSDAGDIAIFCDLRNSPAGSSWIAGHPGAFRKVMAFLDSVAGGRVWGLAVSRNPVRAFDACGNLVVWCNIQMPDQSEFEHTLLCLAAGGEPLVIARQGDATPIGGTYTGMSGWPSMADRLAGTYGAYTPGSGVPNAYFKFESLVRGDLNCDGQVDFGDINPFVLALADPAGYHVAFPDCDINLGDINADGQVNFDDINPFVTLLSGGF